MSRIAVTFVIAAFFTVILAAHARSVTSVYHGKTGAAFKPVLYDEKIPGGIWMMDTDGVDIDASNDHFMESSGAAYTQE